MGALDALWHILNFMAPAVFMALATTFAGRYFKKNKAFPGGYWAWSGIHFGVNLGILILGVVITGHDGKMITYLAMIVASATVQWLLMGAWRQ